MSEVELKGVCGEAAQCWLDRCDVCGGVVCIDFQSEIKPFTMQDIDDPSWDQEPRIPCTDCEVPQQMSGTRRQFGYHFICPDCAEENFTVQEPSKVERDEERDVKFIHQGGGGGYVFCQSCDAEFGVVSFIIGMGKDFIVGKNPQLFHKLVRPE